MDAPQPASADAGSAPGAPRVRLLTVGHGTAAREEMAGLLTAAHLELLVDVRSAPGSRRHPQFNRQELETWIPAIGISYRWERDLGGFRRTRPSSRHVALRNASFRGYADYMDSAPFADALARLMATAGQQEVALMCAESLWWRCHRRMIADAATLLYGAEVLHLGHDGRVSPHRLTEGVRLDGAGGIVYAPEDPAATGR